MSEPKTDSIMAAYTKWQSDGSPDNQTLLLNELKPQISSALRSFAPGMEKQMELKAYTMTMGAIKSYDKSKGMHLKSYVYQQLQPLQREYGKRHQPMQIPERHILERKALAQATDDYIAEHGTEPSTQQLADFTGTSIRRIAQVRKNRVPMTETSQVNQETGSSMLSIKDDPVEVVGHYVYSELDPIDQKIFEWTTGHGGVEKIPVKDMAAKLKISAPAVSQRIARISRKMQEGLNLEL